MDKRIFEYFSVAAKLARRKTDCRDFYLGALAVRNDGAWVQSANGPTVSPSWAGHAEARLARKLDKGSSIVYVARIRRDGHFGMSKPCPNCARILLNKGVKKIFYSIADDQYGVWTLARGHQSKTLRS